MQLNVTSVMPLTQVPSATNAGRTGVQVMQIDGFDRARGEAAPMRVWMREQIGRFTGYGSLNTALTAARNLSRGAERAAVVVQQRDSGGYEVREAVWQYHHVNGRPAVDRAPFRHFHFEDGSLSRYTAWRADEKIEVTAQNFGRSTDGITRWLVDGSRVAELDAAGGSLY